jgi:hypothetical protein
MVVQAIVVKEKQKLERRNDFSPTVLQLWIDQADKEQRKQTPQPASDQLNKSNQLKEKH